VEQVRKLAEDIKKLACGEFAEKSYQDTREGKPYLDVLINNAGTVSSWYVSTPDGFELQFAVNHLAPFLLTHELMPLLEASPTARVITVSSGSHYRTRIHWKDVFMRKHYSCLMAYKQAKLANVMFCTELNRRLGSLGSAVRAFAADPGLVHTDIGLKGTAGIERWVWSRRSNGGDPPEKPAKALTYLACEPSLQKTAHVYWKDCRPLKPSKYSQNSNEAARLGNCRKSCAGLKYSFFIQSKRTSH
jgi:NAD(P)-dependent dehydrogenase (short-subunit alcohol dehydrogenase family)